jgi:dimethylargininase
MLTAITRGVSPNIAACELTFLPRQTIDVNKSILQHRRYEECLREFGLRVISLAVDPYLPDAVFVEDAAIVLDEVAVVTHMGAETRQKEIDGVANALTHFRKIKFLRPPATLDGGDVMRIGRTLCVGLSSRTNKPAIMQLRRILQPFGYKVREVAVNGCLHLKTGCSYIGRNTLLANPEWIDTNHLKNFRLIGVPAAEPWAANTLTIDETTLLPSSFPQTRRLLENQNFRTQAIDICELQKAEAGLTCLSIIFEDRLEKPAEVRS